MSDVRFASQSVSQTLHTTTTSIMRPLLEYHFSTAAESEAFHESFTVIRRVLTALTHHCKAAEQYSPISDILQEYLALSAKSGDTEHEDYLRRLLEVLTVPCSVRGGSRISAKHLSAILSQLLLVPLTDRLHEAYLKLSASCLTAGDMALWMGPGRKVFERAWAERPALALHLTGVLLDLGWGGWQMIALPHLVKRTLDLLEADQEVMKVLEVLNAAYRDKKLAGVDERWKARLQKWVTTRFTKWEARDSQVRVRSILVAQQ